MNNLPPLPPGFKLDPESADLPPLPPGFKLDGATAAPKLQIDETPFIVKPQYSSRFRVDPSTVKSRRYKAPPPENQREIELGAMGVLPDKPGEGALDLQDYQDISYYSAGPEYAKTYIGKKVKQKYAPDSDLDPDELARVKDGSLQYLDLSLEKPRWREVDAGVLYSFGKPAFWQEIGSDLALGIPATIVGSLANPLVGIGAGTAVTGANSYAWRKKALQDGRRLGINEGLSDEDIETMAIGRAATTAGTSALFGVVGARPLRNSGNNLLPHATASGIVDDFDKNTAAANRVVDEVNALRPGADEMFDPTPAQRGNIAEIQDVEATLEAGHAAKATQEIATELRNRRSKNQRVLELLYDTILPSRRTTPEEKYALGLDIRAEAFDIAGKAPEAQAARAAARAKAQVTKELDQIETGLDYEGLLGEIRGMPSPDGKISGTKYYALQDRIVAEQQRLAKIVEERGRNALVEISDKNLLLPKLRGMANRLRVGLQSLNAATGDTATAGQVDELINILTKNDGVVPFNFLDKVHQDLGRLQGKINTSPGRGVADQDVTQLAELQALLEDAITQYTFSGKSPARVPARDVVDFWRDRKLATTLRHDIFDRKAVRDVLSNAEPDGVAAKQVFANAFSPNDPRYLQAMLTAVEGDPVGMDSLRKAFLAEYRKSVQNVRGEVNLAAHNKFINERRQHIELLFPNAKDRPITRVGEIQKVAAEASERAKVLDRAHQGEWYRVFGSKYKYSADILVEQLSSLRMKGNDARQLISHLQKTEPELLELVKKEALTSLKIQLGSDRLPTVARLDKFLNSSSAKRLTELMGPAEGQAYLRNLQTLRDAIDISTRKGKSLGTPATTLLTATTRAAFGPLHRIQRFFTAGRQVYQWMNAKDAYAVIGDPARLKAALQYSATAPGIKAVPAAIALDIGALAALLYQQETAND